MVKMEESQIKGNFLLNSPRLVLHVLNFIGDFLNSTLASLARGAFLQVISLGKKNMWEFLTSETHQQLV